MNPICQDISVRQFCWMGKKFCPAAPPTYCSLTIFSSSRHLYYSICWSLTLIPLLLPLMIFKAISSQSFYVNGGTIDSGSSETSKSPVPSASGHILSIYSTMIAAAYSSADLFTLNKLPVTPAALSLFCSRIANCWSRFFSSSSISIFYLARSMSSSYDSNGIENEA